MVESTTLEMWQAGNGLEGSNPSLSAIFGSRFPRQLRSRRFAAALLYSPHKILILKGFATLRVGKHQNFEKFS